MRASGILMHITSLPGPYGVGTMGKAAYHFIDFLQRAGQRYWQILPLTPTGYGDSPYQSCSAYAGNPYLIDLDMLAAEGLLTIEEITACSWGDDPEQVDFGLLYKNRLQLLRKAYIRFQEDGTDFARFCGRNENWLPEYAHYMALKEQFGGKPWYEWPDGMKYRQIEALNASFRDLSNEIRFHCFVQYLFGRQWETLRTYAHSKGVSIIGDVPIYVPYDSADVWSRPEMFCLDENLTPTAVAGCPPDYFSQDGQLWGNPLYRWQIHKQTGFHWWLQRLQGAKNRYDVIRIDHFRGFAGYYAIPYGAENAREGKWLPGPGLELIETVKKHLPDTLMIAEDLGFLTEDVHKLRDDSGYPGMKVLEFAFDGNDQNPYLPYMHTPNSVCYIGTHDNMPVGQWLAEGDGDAVSRALAYMGDPQNPVWGMIRLCLASASNLAIVQLQDYLELGSGGRMNFPGTCTGKNWTWRATPDFLLDDMLAQRIRELTRIYGRDKEMEYEL